MLHLISKNQTSEIFFYQNTDIFTYIIRFYTILIEQQLGT